MGSDPSGKSPSKVRGKPAAKSAIVTAMSNETKSPPRRPADRLADSYVPSPLPSIDVDGGLVLARPRTLPPARPALCREGPCRHHHEFVVPAQEAESLDGSDSDHHAQQTIQACYPSPGIELELTDDAPVFECSRWAPKTAAEINEIESRRIFYLATRAPRTAPESTIPTPPEE